MTSLDLYNAALVELNKLKAPSLLLEDYNYFINKAIQQYVNIIYNKYDTNQQTTDDLRVLTARAVISSEDMNDNFFNLPDDYVHLLNCIVEFTAEDDINKCNLKGSSVSSVARRATADVLGAVLNNTYLKPSYKRPYYYLHYISDPVNIDDRDNLSLTSESPDSRLANSSKVQMEIVCGTSKYKPSKVSIDYLRAPKYIYLDIEDITGIVDKTNILEFPDYVCYEIINLFTRLVMENASDPRLQTNPIINTTISEPIPTGTKR